MPKLTGFAHVPIPGPAPIPLLGHIPRVFQFLADPLAALRALREYGDVAAVSRGNPALVVAYGPDRNREVLANPGGFRHDEELITGPPGSSLDKMSKVIININGELHKRHRKLMAPAFSKAALDRYAADIVRIGEATLERWPVGRVGDLDRLASDLALRVALRSLFGLEVMGELDELGRLAVEFTELISTPLTVLLPYDLPGAPYRKARIKGELVMRAMQELIDRKRASGKIEDDALSLLIHATDDEAGSLTNDELLSEAVTLFIAGHETTAKTLSWTMFLLERHPKILAELLEELDGVLAGRSVGVEDLPNLPLLDRVLKEGMRTLSPVPTVFLRVPSQSLPLGRFVLPKGANVVISPFMTHHDPLIYSQPGRFDPERWTRLKPTPFEYLPFGAGPRMCIGAAFAQQALRLLLATILQRVRFSVVRGADISQLIRTNILLAKHGIPAHIQAPHRRTLKVEPIKGNIAELVELAA